MTRQSPQRRENAAVLSGWHRAAANDNVSRRYAANGNLSSDGTRTYTFDAADRLKTITQGATTVTFQYDGLGRRLKQTVGATETRHLWCGAAICQQRSASDTAEKRFYSEGEYVHTGTKKYLTLTDHLGSVRDVIDITGTPTLVGSFDYRPYGEVARSWGTVTTGYTYAGLFAQTNTGLLLSTTRAYDPTNGHWLNRDPKREAAAGENQFAYTLGNPIKWNDPRGTDVIIGVHINPIGKYPHSIIVITYPGSDVIIGRQVFGDGFEGGEYASPPYSGFWDPGKITVLDRIVTDQAGNDIALNYLKSLHGTREPYKLRESDCNTHAPKTWSEIIRRLTDYIDNKIAPIKMIPVDSLQ